MSDTPRPDAAKYSTGIIGLCRTLEQELKASQAEVERLKKRPFGCKCETLREKVLGDGCDECNKALVIKMLTDERDELEAEVERLQSGFQGSCYCCEPVGILNQKLEAEVERLKAKLYRAIEIADEFWNNQKQAVLVYHQELADELGQLKATFNQEKK